MHPSQIAAMCDTLDWQHRDYLSARIRRLWMALVLSQALMGVAVLALYLRILFP